MVLWSEQTLSIEKGGKYHHYILMHARAQAYPHTNTGIAVAISLCGHGHGSESETFLSQVVFFCGGGESTFALLPYL